MLRKDKRIHLFRSAIIFAMAILLASCGGMKSDPGDIVMEYYTAIENGDADAAAALFSETARAVVPSGTTFTGDEITQFISYDLQFMDHVEFQTDFTESNGKITWTQEYHHVDGNSWVQKCEATIEDDKIVEWLLSN